MPGFILRIDDCGWNEQKERDTRLRYFDKFFWQTRHGLSFRGQSGVAYFGFIPAMLHGDELEYIARRFVGSPHSLAVHGWTHWEGEVVGCREMELAEHLFRFAMPTPCYIPPFNRYNPETVRDWQRATHGRRSVFFGGLPYDMQSVNYGDKPRMVGEHCVHLPADRELYGRSHEIYEAAKRAIDNHREGDPPRVLTLHATWEKDCLPVTGALMELIGPHLVTVDAAFNWCKQQQPQPQEA